MKKFSRVLRSLLVATIGPFTMSACAEAESSPFTIKDDALDAAMADETFKQVTSVLVSHDRALAYEAYWGAGSPELMNDTRSAMKSLTAMAVGAAIADGHLEGVDQQVMPFFAEERPFRFESALKDAVTIRDLLSMSSALDCNDNQWESPGNEEHMYPARRWVFFVVDTPTKDDYARDANGYGPFSYCTAGSFLLGQIVERAAGKPIDQYIEQRLLAPLGISDVNWDRSPSNEVMTGGGAELKSRDLLALGELVLNGGVHEGERILPAKWIDEMTRKHVAANDEQDYGYQWWLRHFACGEGAASGWYMAGNGGNKIAVFKELDLVVVVTAQLYGTRGMHQQSTDIIEDYVLAGHPACAG